MSVVDIRDAHAREVYERNFVLVRPDQHVAWRGDRMPADPLAVIDTIRERSDERLERFGSFTRRVEPTVRADAIASVKFGRRDALTMARSSGFRIPAERSR